MEETPESYLTDTTLDRPLHQCCKEEFDQLVDAFFPSSSPANSEAGEKTPQSVQELSPVTAIQHTESSSSPQLAAEDAVSDHSSRIDATSALDTVPGAVTFVTHNAITSGDLQPATHEAQAYIEDREEQVAAARTLLDLKRASSSPLLCSSRRRAREDSSLTPSEAEVEIPHIAGQVTEDLVLTENTSASTATFLPHHSSTIREANDITTPLGDRTDSPIQADQMTTKLADLLEAADYLASAEGDDIGSERLIDEVIQPLETPGVLQQNEMVSLPPPPNYMATLNTNYSISVGSRPFDSEENGIEAALSSVENGARGTEGVCWD